MVVEKGYKLTDLGAIPEDWHIALLDDLIDNTRSIRYGILQPGKFDPNGRYLVRGQDYSFGWADPHTLFRVTPNVEEKYKNARLKSGDLVLTIVGASTGHVESVPNWLDGANITQTTARIPIDNSKANSEYCKQYLNSSYGWKIVSNFIKGAAQPGLNIGDIRIFKIITPPLPEQTAIATALSDMDALIAQTEKLIEKKKAIKQGVMQELLRPKVGWVTKKLGEKSLILRGGSPRPIEDYLTTAPDGINWVKIGDVGKNAKYITSTEEKITPAGMSRSRVVKPGDFLLSNSMSFGRPYIMQIDGCIHDGWLVITEYESNFDRDFLYYVLGSEAVFAQYKSMASGSSVLNLNKEIVKAVNIICPENLDEQVRIANILSDIDIDLDFTKTKLQKLQLQKQGMMQALLTGKIRLV
jgi:type I restriction enzyme S subunit